MSEEITLNTAMLKDLIEKIPQACMLLKMMANEDRLALLCQLAIKECHVAELEELLGIKQPTLSQQLGILRRSEGVKTRRQGKYIYYQVTNPHVLQILLNLWNINCEQTQKAMAVSQIKKKKTKPDTTQGNDKQFQLL